MSVAEAFSYPDGAFPFCFRNEIPVGCDTVGGLTLTQIAQLWWSLESLNIDSVGEYDGVSEINFNKTAPVADPPSVFGENSFIDAADTSAPQAPKARVCVQSDFAVSLVYSDTDSFGNAREFYLTLIVDIDPDDEDFFAVHYKFSSYARSTIDNASLICNPSNDAYAPTGTPQFTGSTSIGGIAFDWIGGPVLYLSLDGSWTTGPSDFSLTFSADFFTYP